MRIREITAVLLAAFCPALLPARGDGTLKAPAGLTTAPSPTSAAAGDFNRDGRKDLAVLNSKSLQVFLQDPEGRRMWVAQPPLELWANSFYLLAADLDGDQLPDLVVAEPGAGATVLRSLGDGTFEVLDFPPTPGPRWLASGDWQLDGRLDMVTANWVTQGVGVYEGIGGALFQHVVTYPTIGLPHSITGLAWNSDDHADVLSGCSDSGLVPYRGNGDGTFEAQTPLSGFTPGCHRTLLTVDFNLDGRDDLITSCGVAINNGDGTFRRTLDSIVLAAAGGHLNADGKPDLVLAGPIGFTAYLGDGTGKFSPPANYGPGSAFGSFLLAVDDLDADGRGDVITGGSSASSIHIFWGVDGGAFEVARIVKDLPASRAVATADFDGNGLPDLFVDVSDPPQLSVYLDFAATAAAPRSFTVPVQDPYSTLKAVDLNGDGTPDATGAQTVQGLVLAAILGSDRKVVREASLPAGNFPADVVAGRLDAGDSVDLVAPCTGSNDLAAFINDGTGRFGPARRSASISRPRGLVLVDFNADGRLDAAVHTNGEIALQAGQGSGDFAAPATLRADPAERYSALIAADLDADGKTDLIAGEQAGSDLLIFTADGRGGFAPPQRQPLLREPARLAAGHLDGDDTMDLGVAYRDVPQVTTLRGWGSAAFQAATYAARSIPAAFEAGDFDGDSALDLFSYGGAAAEVLLGRQAAPPRPAFRRGDADGNERVDLNDPVSVLVALFMAGQPTRCEDAADANDDGAVDIADPIFLLHQLFLGDGQIPPPNDCGEDPTPDLLPDCEVTC